MRTVFGVFFEPALPAAFKQAVAARRLRGRKCEPFDGGTRTVALVSGGFVPAHLCGGTFDGLMHVADWYATLSSIVGVDPSDPAQFRGAVRDIDGASQPAPPVVSSA